MKSFFRALAALGVAAQIAEGSFLRDVVGSRHEKSATEKALLAKAIPLDEYRANIRAQGFDTVGDARGLEQAYNAYDGYYGDDYYMNEDAMNSFSGYSLKYGACQPVQKFSEEAIYAGEYTPMITEDIVILRLCPSTSCSSNRKFGCFYNYIEYAIGVSDYVRIMLRHRMDKKQQLCNWCSACSGQRNLEGDEDQNEENQNEEDQDGDNQDENNQEEENENQDQMDDDGANNDAQGDDAVAEQDYGDDGNQAAGDDGNQVAGDDAYNGDDGNQAYSNYWGSNGNDDSYGSNGCDDYTTYCYDNGTSVCADDDGGNYLDDEGYLNYLECSNVNGYYLRPRCNGYDQTIKMGIYYDPFCSQYAGDNVNIYSLGLGMARDAFTEFYSSTACVDCSENVSDTLAIKEPTMLVISFSPLSSLFCLFQKDAAPYFNASANMCNRMHVSGAKCTSKLQSDFSDSNSNSSNSKSACSYIESLRSGTYDEQGRLYNTGVGGSNSRQITTGQKWGVALSLLLCALLAVYSCYLHHSITNLLIRSLSYTDLLPPSRNGRQRSVARTRSHRRQIASDNEDDWDVVNNNRRGSSRSRR
jgi:hypothetical protein